MQKCATLQRVVMTYADMIVTGKEDGVDKNIM
jgi:hypothetical protein